MKTIDEMLRHLARPEVREFGLVSNRLPSVNVGGRFEPVDDRAPSTDAVLQMLLAVGGSRHVETLGSRPVQWTFRAEGLGVVTVAAILRGDIVQVRFTLTQKAIPGAPGSKPASVKAPMPSVIPDEMDDDDAEATLQTSVPQDLGAHRAPVHTTIDEVPRAKPPRTQRVSSELSAVRRDPRAEPEDEGSLRIAVEETPFPVRQTPPRGQDEVTTDAAATSTSPRNAIDPAAAAAILQMADHPAPAPPLDVAYRDPLPTLTSAGNTRQPPAPSSGIPVDLGIEIDRGPIGAPSHDGESSLLRRELPLSARGAPEVAVVLGGSAEKPLPMVASPASPPSIDPDLRRHVPPSFAGPPSLVERAGAVSETDIETAPSRAQEFGLLAPLLALADQAKASDLLVVAGRPLLLRIATDLEPRGEPLSAERVAGMLAAVPARLLSVLERDGSCDFAIDAPELPSRYRVNVVRQRTGYKFTFRVVPRQVPTLASLGLPEAIAQATKHHQGLILLTGPTGHGKTSTLAALVDILNATTNHHILTVEDPIEFLHPKKSALVSQREIGTHARSFTSALKASLREDPDVICVGELRDPETVRMAVAASETGHLVIATMNTPSAAKTIDRVIDMFPPADQPQIRMTLAASLRLIVSQRLVPTTDGKNLVAAVELLPGSIALYTLIRDGRTFQIPSLQQRGRALGIVRLDESLGALVRDGKVTLDVAKTFAESPAELEAVVSGRGPASAIASSREGLGRGLFGGRKV